MSSPPSPRSIPPSSREDEFVEYAEDASNDLESHKNYTENEKYIAFPPTANDAGVSDSDRPRPPLARRSTLMLKDDDLPASNEPNEAEGPVSRVPSGEHLDLGHTTSNTSQSGDGLVETLIEWSQGGHSVYVTGSFTGWRQMIPLKQTGETVFQVTLKLVPGTHRLRFVVDGELRCSDYMLTATDSMGNLVNYMEVKYPGAPREPSYNEMADEVAVGLSPQLEYTTEIPELFAEPEALEKLSVTSGVELTTPPQLPPFLDGVILNTNWNDKDNNSVLPIPNHVVLNHLATTSIKHNVLAVASVSRYETKYVTQILYSPIEGI